MTKEQADGGVPNEERPGGGGHIGLLGCVVNVMGAGDGVYVGSQEQEVDQDVDDLAGRPSGWIVERETTRACRADKERKANAPVRRDHRASYSDGEAL